MAIPRPRTGIDIVTLRGHHRREEKSSSWELNSSGWRSNSSIPAPRSNSSSSPRVLNTMVSPALSRE